MDQNIVFIYVMALKDKLDKKPEREFEMESDMSNTPEEGADQGNENSEAKKRLIPAVNAGSNDTAEDTATNADNKQN